MRKRLLFMSVAAMCCGIASAKTNELFTIENGKIVAFCGNRFGGRKSNEAQRSDMRTVIQGIPSMGECHVFLNYDIGEWESLPRTMYRGYCSKIIESKDTALFKPIVDEADKTINRILSQSNCKYEFKTIDETLRQVVTWRFDNGYLKIAMYNLGYAWIVRLEAAQTTVWPKFDKHKFESNIDYPCTNDFFEIKNGKLISFLGKVLGAPKPQGVELGFFHSTAEKVEIPLALPHFYENMEISYGTDNKLRCVSVKAKFNENDKKECEDVVREAYRAVNAALNASGNATIKPEQVTGPDNYGIRWKLSEGEIFLSTAGLLGEWKIELMAMRRP